MRGCPPRPLRFPGASKDLVERLEKFMPRVVKGERPGLVFNVSYGVQGQARYTHAPSILEMVGIPYIASGPLAHSLCLDTVVTKMILRQHGLPTPDFAVLNTPDEPASGLTYPLIVKPKNEAVSFGLKVVGDEAELRAAAVRRTAGGAEAGPRTDSPGRQSRRRARAEHVGRTLGGGPGPGRQGLRVRRRPGRPGPPHAAGGHEVHHAGAAQPAPGGVPGQPASRAWLAVTGEETPIRGPMGSGRDQVCGPGRGNLTQLPRQSR